MGEKYSFDVSICDSSVFKHKKMDAEDILLIKELDIRDWDDKCFDYELKLKYGRWVVSKDRNMFLIGLGGGSFEIPEMFAFVIDRQKIKIECGGGGEPANIYTRLEDDRYNNEIRVSRLYMPDNLRNMKESILPKIAEAFAIRGYQDKHLKIFSIAF